MSLINAMLHVAPKGDAFGIRIRLSRTAPAVWIGQGWAVHPEADRLGATASVDGWTWPTSEAAEGALRILVHEIKTHGFEQGMD